jgi:hypothetical protein
MKHHSILLLTALIGAAASLIAILSWLGVHPPAVHQPPRTKAQTAAKSRSSKKAARSKLLDGAPVAGKWQYHDGTVLVAGKLFNGYGTLSAGEPFATFDAQGWDTFTVSIGVKDDHSEAAPEFDAALEADGQRLWEQRVKPGERPQTFQITLRGQRAVTLRCLRALNADGTPYTGEISDLVFAEPRLGGK